MEVHSFVRGSLVLAAMSAAPAFGHGILAHSRMEQVRLAGPGGNTPAPWNDSYYTYNQDSNNFPNYANSGYSYAADIPNGKIAEAGINDGVQSSLNFSGLDTPSAGWQTTSVTAGQSMPLQWIATATHDPSHFVVFLTTQSFDPTTTALNWSSLQNLGSWSESDPTHLVTAGTGTNPVTNSSAPTYNWNITIPADRSGRAALVVIWQRDDPAGEAFIGVQDLQVTPASVPEPTTLLAMAAPLLMRRRKQSVL